VARELLYRLLEAGDHPALDSEDIEEVIPKGLALGDSRVSPIHSFEKAMARCLISFQERGIARHHATVEGWKTSRDASSPSVPPTRLPAPGKQLSTVFNS